MRTNNAGETLKLHRAAVGLSQMALAVRIGVTLPAVSGWERNLYKPRRPTAQRLDDALHGGGEILAAFGYAPLPSAAELATPVGYSEDRIRRLEELVAELSSRLDSVQVALENARGAKQR